MSLKARRNKMVQAATVILYSLYIGIMAYIIVKNYENARRLKETSERFLLAIHDIKNYSTNIDATGQLLKAAVNSKYGSLAADNLSSHIDVIIGNCKEMNGLIESFSRTIKLWEYSDKGNQVYEDVVSLIDEAVKLSKYYAKKKNVQLEVKSRWSEKLVELDKIKFIRILSNLIMNGVKYSSENGRVLISMDEDNDWIRIHVKDNGKGMNKQELSRVFKKHYRGNSKTDEADISFGIGLYGSKQLARSMDGRIEAKSVEGEGSEFTLILPLKSIHRKNILGITIPNKILNKKTSV
ncbi:sensor histidine kinase [Lutispora thermophila]|nr:HAMP domain-containing sensor histidine kinase [Lutispora thermophila]